MKIKLSVLFLGGIFLFTVLLGAGCSKDAKQQAKNPPDENAAAQDDDSTIVKESDDTATIETDDDTTEQNRPGWQSFVSEKVSLLYPPNWKVTDDGKAIYRDREGLTEEFEGQDHYESIDRMADASLIVITEPSNEEETLSDLTKYVDYHETLGNIIIDGREAILVNCSGIGYFECVLLTDGGKKITIFMSYAGDENFDAVKKEVAEILATIKLH